MAPDVGFSRHQLGEANFSFQRTALKTPLLLLCLLLLFGTGTIEAKTLIQESSWDKLSRRFLAYERPSQGETLVISSIAPYRKPLSPQPVGRWSSKSQIPIPDQPAIQKYVRYYKGRGRVGFLTALKRSWPLVHIMADVLESYGVPAELVYVVLVESHFNGKATSPKGAGGYWQLLGSTARSLGLRVDRWVDERYDPIKSTQAAAKYLRSSYDELHSWPLALVAYNAGIAPAYKAVKQTGCKDFWELCRRGYFPQESRAFVPKILAAIKIARDLESHDFEAPQYLPIYDFESVWVRSPLKLQEVAKWSEVPVKQLRILNPSLCSDRLPPDRNRGFALRLPPGTREKFAAAYEGYLQR